jgi:hypothetical protein
MRVFVALKGIGSTIACFSSKNVWGVERRWNFSRDYTNATLFCQVIISDVFAVKKQIHLLPGRPDSS